VRALIALAVCAVALAGCSVTSATTIDTIETDVLASLTKEPPPDVQGTILDIDCPGRAQTDEPKEGTPLECGAFNVDKLAHTPEEQIGKVMVVVGQEGDFKFEPCSAIKPARGPKC